MDQQTDSFLMGDQPVTCPKCGARTEFEDKVDSKSKLRAQTHQCLDASCQYQFQVEEI